MRRVGTDARADQRHMCVCFFWPNRQTHAIYVDFWPRDPAEILGE